MSAIEWCDRSDWNPIRGCTRVSEGCRNCYAERIAGRFSDLGQPFHGFATRTPDGGRWTGKVELIEERLTLPLKWRQPAVIFVNSAFDLFHEAIDDATIDRVFAVMALAPHEFVVLTKRPRRMRTYLSGGPWGAIETAAKEIAVAHLKTPRGAHVAEVALDVSRIPLPNVYLGVSAERQQEADERIPDLLVTPAAKRIVSIEPMIAEIDLRHRWRHGGYDNWLAGERWFPGAGSINSETTRGLPRLDGVIVGGESGPRARPMHPDWPRAIRDQCAAECVPFFYKQWGEWIDADEWLRMMETPTGRVMVGSRRLESPLNYGDAEILAGITNSRFEHQSDGSTMIRVGKARAGRQLDGREQNDLPWGVSR